MQENTYIVFLASSLLGIVLLDALVKSFMKSIQAASIVNAALIVWLPSSVGVSLWLLHHTMLGVLPFTLPFWNTSDIRAVVGRRVTEAGKFGTLLAFGHAWLTLSRFIVTNQVLIDRLDRLARLSTSCPQSFTVYNVHGNQVAKKTISESSSTLINPGFAVPQWFPVGLPITLLSVVLFGKCLLVLGVQEDKWGYFLEPYRMITYCFDIYSRGINS
ncbi:hypothetical protein BT96DRAFT_1047230 [Gymnopus androsaceus JB14]|uniref:Uncharacterized protein n=1 Tax=Gymnopus androsaceus JB14 TaxID=1447944 RepID=A0A6A4GBJ2_9AGAR|nr:hypothetical protein BT96DRAFT_1047230 [Gymnopus androsaceus JB14]